MGGRAAVAVCLLLLSGCSGAVRHPLDDSESKPSTLDGAVDEANVEMKAVGAAALSGAAYVANEWAAPDGCGVSSDHPEQGEVSRVLEHSYPELPDGVSQSSALDAAADHWSSGGHTVGEGSPEMEEQRIVRIHGISYATAAVDAGIDVRAFLPCY